MDIATLIANHPKTCYRVLELKAFRLLGHLTSSDYAALMAARPECGYRCDGDEGPHPLNGSPGCYYSGRCEA